MMTWRSPLVEFPPVPTAAMASLGELVQALQACKKASAWPEVRRYAKQGFARLWLHFALERGLDPRKAAPTSSPVHLAVAQAYLSAGVRLGLGDRTTLAWDLQEVSSLAASLWCQAKEAQSAMRASQAPLLGLDLEPATPADLPEPR